jgi:hypothetical protein
MNCTVLEEDAENSVLATERACHTIYSGCEFVPESNPVIVFSCLDGKVLLVVTPEKGHETRPSCRCLFLQAPLQVRILPLSQEVGTDLCLFENGVCIRTIFIVVSTIGSVEAGGEFALGMIGALSVLACANLNGTVLSQPSKMPRINLFYELPCED